MGEEAEAFSGLGEGVEGDKSESGSGFRFHRPMIYREIAICQYKRMGWLSRWRGFRKISHRATEITELIEKNF